MRRAATATRQRSPFENHRSQDLSRGFPGSRPARARHLDRESSRPEGALWDQDHRACAAVSDDDGIAGYAKRKAARRQQVAGFGDDALTLFAADNLSKLRELREEAGDEPNGCVIPSRVRELRARRLRHYQRSLALLEERLPDSPLVRALRDELAAVLRNRSILTEMREPARRRVRCPARRLGEASRDDRRGGAARAAHARAVTRPHRSSSTSRERSGRRRGRGAAG